MKIRIVMIGRTRHAGIRDLLDDYLARIGHYAEVEVTELREGSQAVERKLKVAPGATMVLLDAAGKQFASSEFAKWLGGLRDRGAREVVFLCGGAGGFPQEVQQQAQQSVSLSRLTMPHELARVVLVEQIYRAFAILAGHPYPK